MMTETTPDGEKYPERYGTFGKYYASGSSEHFMMQRDEQEKQYAERIEALKKPPVVTHVDFEEMEDDLSDLETFPSGAVRGSQEGKSRVDLLDPRFILRVGEHMASQVDERSGALNYTKGIPSSRYMAGLFRHVLKYYAGDRTEDHPSAIVFNAQGLAMNEGTELDDLHDWNGS
jgi:dATP/dGTP diphosphohydrolase